VLNKQLNETPPRPTGLNSSLSPKVEAVILKCLNKERGQRYQSADDLYEALEELQSPSGGSTSKISVDSSQEIFKSVRANTVMLGDFNDAEETDPHAETMAGWEDPLTPGVL